MPRKAKAPGKGKQKLKTHKATAKRFRMTGTGIVVRTKAMLSEMIPVKGASFIKRIKRLAPYMRKYKANPPA